MRFFAALLLLLGAGPLPAQDYGYPYPPQGTIYQRVDRNTVAGSDGQIYFAATP